MLCIVVTGPTINESRTQIQAALTHADIVELRLDHFTQRSYSEIEELKNAFFIPMIFTLRSKLQGGHYIGSEEERMAEIKSLASCGPAYIDLEDHVPHAFIEEISLTFPQIKLIISHHNFEKSILKLETVLDKMPKIEGAFYKIASMAHSIVDTLQIITQTKNMQNLISISMGEDGEISRILAPVYGSKMSYACLKDARPSAPGQMLAQDLVNIYRYPSMNAETELFGLIGNPITGSIGHLTNNAVMKVFHRNAVYVKIRVEEKNLKESLDLLKNLGFRGLAVTMPLKEVILPYLDAIDPEAKSIGAVSFVHFDKGRLVGYNKDGYGALESLENIQKVKGKKLIILGAGGASRAIAFEAKRRGAQVVILNRTLEKAKCLADEFGCEGDTLETISKYYEEGYDFLVNCLPYYLQKLPIDAAYIDSHAVVMDITSKPMLTDFLNAAQSKGCKIVPGYQMFIHQTNKQFQVWFSENLDSQKVLEILRRTAEDVLKNFG